MSQSKRILAGHWTHPLLQTYNGQAQTLKHLTHLYVTITTLCSKQIKKSTYAKFTQKHRLTANLSIDTCSCKIDHYMCNHQERCMFPCRGTCCLQILHHNVPRSDAAAFLCHATAKGSKQIFRNNRIIIIKKNKIKNNTHLVFKPRPCVRDAICRGVCTPTGPHQHPGRGHPALPLCGREMLQVKIWHT